MREYPIILTLKTNQAMISRLEAQAAAVGRNRSEYIRDLINTLADREDVREAVTKALNPTQV